MDARAIEGVAVFDERDNWPHTKRLLPWILAAFLVMVFLIPFDGTVLKVHLPVDSKPDRFILVLMAGVLIFTRSARPKRGRRRTGVERAIWTFAGVAVLSIVLNIDRIYQLNQLGAAEKRLSELLTYFGFFFIVVATVRAAEMAAFARLIIVLTCLTAVGTLYEAHTGVNVFYLWSGKLLHSVASVIPAPTAIHPTNGGRPTIVGPTTHGLALTSMLTIALPFAVLPLLEGRRIGKSLLYLLVIGLILAAQLATARKTAMIAPVAAFAVLMAYKRELLRWAPLALVFLVIVIHSASPGALGTVGDLISHGGASSSSSTAGRVNDYSAVAPDVLSNLLVGRGYGTLDASNVRWYRILDNEYLSELFQVGVLGLLAYLAVIVSALSTAHGVIKRRRPHAPIALAAAAGCAAFGLVSATFDAMAFPQAPYTFMFAAGLIAVAAGERPEVAAGARAIRGRWKRSSMSRPVLAPAREHAVVMMGSRGTPSPGTVWAHGDPKTPTADA